MKKSTNVLIIIAFLAIIPILSNVALACDILDGTCNIINNGGYETTQVLNLTDKLISYWTFDELSGDSRDWISGYNASSTGAVTKGVTGKINKAWNYTQKGTGNYSSATLNPTSHGNFSIAIWMKPTDNFGTSSESLIVGDNAELEIYSNSSGFLFYQLNTNTIGSTKIPDWHNTWHYLVLTSNNISGTINASLYVDGAFNSSASGSWSGVDDGIIDFAEEYDVHPGFNGTIDDSAVWNRTLTSQEITALYNSGNGLPLSGFTPNVTVMNVSFSNSTMELSPNQYNITIFNNTPVFAKFYYGADTYTNGFTIWTNTTTNLTTFAKSFNTSANFGVDVNNFTLYWEFNDSLDLVDMFSNNYYQLVYGMIIKQDNSGGAVHAADYKCYDNATGNPLACTISAIYNIWNPTNYNLNGMSESQTLYFYGNYNYPVYKFPPNNVSTTLKYDAYFYISSAGYNSIYPTYTAQYLYSNGTVQTYNFNLTAIPGGGAYVTFEVVDGVTKNPIQQAALNVSNSTGNLVCSGTTDSAGTVSCSLDQTKTYTINVSAQNYPLWYGSITPTQSLYIISLGSGNFSTNDTMSGVSFSISPSGALLENVTSYTFRFNISSIYNPLQNYGFNLTNGTALFSSTTGSTANGSNLSKVTNTLSNTTIYMVYWWTINNNTVAFTKVYGVIYNYQGNYSLKTAFVDIRNFATRSEFGGTGSFTLMLIAFFIILISVGAVSIWSGGINPIAIGLTIVSETWLLYWVGLIPPFPAPGLFANLIPITITVLFIAYMIWEAIR